MKRALALAMVCATVGLGLPAAAQDAKPAPGAGVGQGGWNAKVQPGQGAQGIALEEKQIEAIKKVSGYFGDIKNMKGAFVQTGADKKRMKGKFYLKRPGKFRFDYALPSKQVIISDGEYLAIQDHDLNNEDRVALDQTPFRLLLRKDVDLLRDARMLDVQETEDMIVLALQDKDPDAPGKIKLVLSTKPALELKEWVTLDAQGLETRVEVTDIVRTEEVDVSLFKIQPMGLNKFQP